MELQEHLPLWNKIQAFAFDDAAAVITFSGKLAATQNWSPSFTQRAIEEYRKFMLLCCISEKGAAPSQTVDEVWHLHLTYTRSYWIDFCRDTLNKDIHHYPSTGGEQEDNKHQEWYKETLQLYRSVFGIDPPPDIWPAPMQEASQEIPVPDDPHFTLSGATAGGIAIVLSLPFFFIWAIYQTPNPFLLGGPHFLIFFPIYAVTIFLSCLIYRHQFRKQLQEITAGCLPEDASAFQVAEFLYGKHRAIQAGIVDLIKRGLLTVVDKHRFIVKSGSYTPFPEETNPLIIALTATSDGSMVSYEEISVDWYDQEKFSHPAFTAMKQFAQRRQPFFHTYIFHLALYGMVAARIVQGLGNGRPIGFLIGETMVVSFFFLLVTGLLFHRKIVVCRKVYSVYKERFQNLDNADARIVPGFALEGLPAIDGFAEGALLAGAFGTYAQAATWRNWTGGGGDSSGSGGGCSSGGGSCGSSCGGCGGGH
jgi:uncharacterized protein (TIGR04222 family)